MSSILFLVLFHFKCSKFVYRVGRTRAAHHSITTGEDFLQALLNVGFSKLPGDIPRGPVVQNLPANARDQFDPWSRKILRGLTAPTTTTEPMLSSSQMATRETTTMKSPCTASRE